LPKKKGKEIKVLGKGGGPKAGVQEPPTSRNGKTRGPEKKAQVDPSNKNEQPNRLRKKKKVRL